MNTTLYLPRSTLRTIWSEVIAGRDPPRAERERDGSWNILIHLPGGVTVRLAQAEQP